VVYRDSNPTLDVLFMVGTPGPIFKGLNQMSPKKLQHMFTIKATGCWIWQIAASRSYTTSALV
jgi:hypothetical protein